MRRDDTKRRIMDAALELFAAHGYDAVSVEQIAGAVGIKAPSLYNHFVSKRAIFDEIVSDAAARYEDFTALGLFIERIKEKAHMLIKLL